MGRVKPMARWWLKPLGSDDALDTCIGPNCTRTREAGRPSCAECWCPKCFGYGEVCRTCDEGPAFCVCSEPDPKTCEHPQEGGRGGGR